jgi:hypothetical protein
MIDDLAIDVTVWTCQIVPPSVHAIMRPRAAAE